MLLALHAVQPPGRQSHGLPHGLFLAAVLAEDIWVLAVPIPVLLHKVPRPLCDLADMLELPAARKPDGAFGQLDLALPGAVWCQSEVILGHDFIHGSLSLLKRELVLYIYIYG